MSNQRRISVFLICGFLGSGKTSLLRHLLSSPREGEKVAVLINEFGDISLDGDLIRRDGLEMVELANGCICCSLRIDFRLALQRIVKEIRPTTLYVEATGLAQPHDLLEALSTPEMAEEVRLEALITVVDAHFFRVREVLGPFYNKQMENADLVLINKADLVSQETLQEITGQVRLLNSRAVLLPTQFCRFDPSILLSGEFYTSAAALLHASEEKHHHEEENEGGPQFESFLFLRDQPLDKEKFFKGMDSLPSGIFRCKGYVRFKDESIFLNYAAGRYSIEEAEERKETRLFFIGLNLNQEEILEQLT